MTHPIHRAALVLACTSAALFAQVQATYVPYGSGCPGTGTGVGAGNVVPRAFANAFAPSNNVFGFSHTPCKYQQVFLASELPNAFTMTALGLRWDNQTTTAFYGATVDLEIAVGYTTRTPTTLSTTFAANFDSGTPVTVLPRSMVVYPDNPNPPPTDPAQFQLLIPWTQTFSWAPAPGQNLLIQVIQRGSSSGSFAYVLDAGWSPSTARLYGPDTATTGTLDGFAYGYVMSFYALTNTAVPVLGNRDFPQIGGQFLVTLAQAKASTSAWLLFGASRTNWGSYPLPLDLGIIGAPGCPLLCTADVLVACSTNSAGSASFSVAVPMDFGLIGASFFNQYLIADRTANLLGVVVSNAGWGVAGN